MSRNKLTRIPGVKLEEARKRADYSVTELAARIGIDERTWRRWVQAGAIPTVTLPAVGRWIRLELDGDGLSVEAPGRERNLLEELQGEVRKVKDAVAVVTELQMESLARLAKLEEKLEPPASRRQKGRR